MPGEISRQAWAVILTALPVEYKAVRTHLSELREEVHQRGTIYERGRFFTGKRFQEIGIAQIETGNANAAVEAERAIEHFNPRIVLFVGIACGIKDVQPGDVVAATKVYGYASGKAEESTFSTRPEVGQSSHPLIHRARAEGRNNGWLQRIRMNNPPNMPSPRVFVGPIAAGEVEVRSSRSAIASFLRTTYEDSLALEMTGSGFLQAIHANEGTLALIVRGISDLIDHEIYNIQEIAAHHASAFAFEMLAKFDLADIQGTQQPILPIQKPSAAPPIQTLGDIQSGQIHDTISARPSEIQGGSFMLPPKHSTAHPRNELIMTFAVVGLLITIVLALIIFAIVHFL